MSHDTSAVLVGEAESTSPVVADHNSAGAHDLHGEGDADAGQREAIPATTSISMDQDPEPAQVRPSCPTPSSAPGISPSVQQHSHGVTGRSGNAGQTGVTISPPETPSLFFSAVSSLAADAENPKSHNIVAPPTEITPQGPRDVLDSVASPLNQTTTANVALASQSTIEQPISTDPKSAESLPHVHKSTDGAADVKGEQKQDKMIFAHTTSNSMQRRRNYATTNAVTDYEADLTSRDRAKQKEAVKKYLSEKVKNDWNWEWPQPGSEAKLEPTKTIEEDTDLAWKERDEWLSNASDDGDDMKMPRPANTTSSHDTPTPTSKNGVQLDSTEGVGDTITNALFDRKRRRKKRLAEEMAWNEGLRCFTARRDAWTCARKIPRRGNGVVKTTTRASLSSGDGGSSPAIEQDDDDQWEDDTEIPIAPPILPPENAMRASILPGAYNTIYDKVVVQSLTPSCPMNLKDVTRSCVQGWKRDGEWPPKSAPDTLKKKGRKMSVASLLGFKESDRSAQNVNDNGNGIANGNGVARDSGAAHERDRKGSGIRRSLQKILKLGHGGE
ncbi:hypothetical protein ONS95_007213 [Cadophora gregata]|uniref:uncharacterized protein n=1 Tax=Cadophora gregata TaxID=51156 RepID=UPI0026DB19E7|nr:uncharacterized protein ONS95_007213 [Cadophora gregata]KAK0100764.1 hypothetical protein ONS95_007213 [Cadophora gregata]KAK0117242.1 hypothetical protein ONS96_013075 [Cadophora gregata f. sp. sojae]